MEGNQMRMRLPQMSPDFDETLAVVINGSVLATWLGYKTPADTSVNTIEVIDSQDCLVFSVTVDQHSLLSAVWVETWAIYRHISGSLVSTTTDGNLYRNMFDFDDVARAALEMYMGERVCTDARNHELDTHKFVRTLLNADGPVRIRYYYTIR